MVGLEGVPSKNSDVRPGDVVVSKPTRTSCEVVRYDSGKTISGDRFKQISALNQLPQILLTAISQLESTDMIKRNHSISDFLSISLRRILT
jgi:spore germination protein GerM